MHRDREIKCSGTDSLVTLLLELLKLKNENWKAKRSIFNENKVYYSYAD